MREDSIKERLRNEIVGILLVALGIFLFLSLVSYSPVDPSFFSYTSPKVKEIHNWMGIVGAYLSSLLFPGIWISFFSDPVSLGSLCLQFHFSLGGEIPLFEMAGWSVILLTTSSLFGLWLKPIRFFPQDLLVGGFLGEIFSRSLVRYFNPPGATVLLLLSSSSLLFWERESLSSPSSGISCIW